MRRRDFIAGLGAAAMPVTVPAQQPGMPLVGLLIGGWPEAFAPALVAFRPLGLEIPDRVLALADEVIE